MERVSSTPFTQANKRTYHAEEIAKDKVIKNLSPQQQLAFIREATASPEDRWMRNEMSSFIGHLKGFNLPQHQWDQEVSEHRHALQQEIDDFKAVESQLPVSLRTLVEQQEPVRTIDTDAYDREQERIAAQMTLMGPALDFDSNYSHVSKKQLPCVNCEALVVRAKDRTTGFSVMLNVKDQAKHVCALEN